MLEIPHIDCEFEDPPLMLALAQIKFTQSPEIFERITTVKAAMADLGMPVAQSKQQLSVVVQPGSAAPTRLTQNVIWWFHSLDKRRATAFAQNSVVLYDANYSRFPDFSGMMRTIVETVLQLAGPGCFLTTVALRYLSGFAADGSPCPYLSQGLRGIPTEPLGATHFHHQYSFWCSTEHDGRLVVNEKTIHGNQLIPQDLAIANLVINPKFALPAKVDAVQLDIHETIEQKKLEQFDAARIDQFLSGMRRNIKGAFLVATTPEAHQKWKLKIS